MLATSKPEVALTYRRWTFSLQQTFQSSFYGTFDEANIRAVIYTSSRQGIRASIGTVATAPRCLYPTVEHIITQRYLNATTEKAAYRLSALSFSIVSIVAQWTAGFRSSQAGCLCLQSWWPFWGQPVGRIWDEAGVMWDPGGRTRVVPPVLDIYVVGLHNHAQPRLVKES